MVLHPLPRTQRKNRVGGYTLGGGRIERVDTHWGGGESRGWIHTGGEGISEIDKDTAARICASLAYICTWFRKR